MIHIPLFVLRTQCRGRIRFLLFLSMCLLWVPMDGNAQTQGALPHLSAHATSEAIKIVLTQENIQETQDILFDVEMELETGDDLEFQIKNTTENLRRAFFLEDVRIPIGDYNFTALQTALRTSSSRMLAADLSLEVGEFYHGSRRGISLEGLLRPTPKLSIETFIEFNRITLPEAEFDANAFGGRIGYSFSTTLFTKLFTQWSTDRDVLSANFLVNYIYRPGSDFYLVFDQSYDTRNGGLRHLDSTVISKLTYWWNP